MAPSCCCWPGSRSNPVWPREWLEHLGRQPSPHPPALLWPFGFVGLVGLLRWRTPEGRLLAAMTLVPSSAWFYDQLFLMLVARTWKQSLVLGALSWIAFILVLATQAPINLIDPERARGVQRILVLGTYLPAAVLVLRQPNIGSIPAWLERLTARWPAMFSRAPSAGRRSDRRAGRARAHLNAEVHHRASRTHRATSSIVGRLPYMSSPVRYMRAATYTAM